MGKRRKRKEPESGDPFGFGEDDELYGGFCMSNGENSSERRLTNGTENNSYSPSRKRARYGSDVDDSGSNVDSDSDISLDMDYDRKKPPTEQGCKDRVSALLYQKK